MFARRTLALGAFALVGFVGNASAETPVAAATATPVALPTAVVTQSSPVTTTERTRRFGLRRNRTTVMTPTVVQAQATVPTPMPMPTASTTTKPTTAPAATTTTPAEPAPTVVMATESAPVMTTATTGRQRTRLFGRLFARR